MLGYIINTSEAKQMRPLLISELAEQKAHVALFDAKNTFSKTKTF